VVDTVLSGQVTLVTSPALLGELARVLAYPKLTAIFDDLAALVAAGAEAADTVDPAEHVTMLADEPDNRVLEAAAAGRADLIVTGHKAMQELGSFQGIHIVSAAQGVNADAMADVDGDRRRHGTADRRTIGAVSTARRHQGHRAGLHSTSLHGLEAVAISTQSASSLQAGPPTSPERHQAPPDIAASRPG
jgi:putative PIN family toxin of toxin-antitoxin system